MRATTGATGLRSVAGMSRTLLAATAPRTASLAFARVFRTVTWAQLALVFGQALLAGQFLAGADLVWLHGLNAHLIQFLGLGHVLTGVLLWRPGRGPAWPALAALALWLLESTQIGLGYAGLVGAHVPVGVALVALLIALLTGTRHLSRPLDPRSP